MTTQNIQMCKHAFNYVILGISGCAKCHEHCYYANCPDWDPITTSYTTYTTTISTKTVEEEV